MISRPIATYGEVFPDGSIVELIAGHPGGNPRLLLWDGVKETTGALIEYGGMKYEAPQFPRSVLRQLKLPTQSWRRTPPEDRIQYLFNLHISRTFK